MLTWNIRNIREMTKRHEIDIVALEKTFIAEEQRFSLDSYIVYSTDRNIQGIVTAILIKRELEHRVLRTPRDLQSTEALCIEVMLKGRRRLRMISVYAPRQVRQET